MAWKRIAQQDAEVLAATNDILHRDDVDELCKPGSSMTDALVHYAVVECDAWGAKLTHVHNNVFWVNPATVRGASAKFDDMAGIMAAFHERDANVLLYPVLEGERQWSLLAYYKQQDAYVHYDVLGGNDRAAERLLQKLAEGKHIPKAVPFSKPPGLVLRGDAHNSGLYTAQFARAIMALPLGNGRPSEETVRSITPDSSELMRYEMLAALRLHELVDDLPPEPQHHDPVQGGGSGPSQAQPGPPISERDERSQAAKKLEGHVVAMPDFPVGPVAQCGKPKAATLTVTVTSARPEIQTVQSGKATFTIGADKVVRTIGRDGIATLPVPPGKKVTVTVAVQPAPEFQSAEKSQDLQIVEGDANRLTFDFTPKDPRRLYARFVLNDESDKKAPKVRPFPKDFKVQFSFEEGVAAAAASLDDKGRLVDDGDKQPGVRIPWSAATALPRFPGTEERKHIAWDDKSPEQAPTRLIAEGKPPQGTVAGPLLPSGTWYPHADTWELPKEHKGPGIEVPQAAARVGREDQPLLYKLKAQPQSRLMNGHPIDHVVVLMLENRGFDHFMGWLYEGADQPKHHYPASPKGKHAQLRPFEGLEGIDGTNPVDFEHTHKPKIGSPIVHKVQHDFTLRKGARACNVPRINPHEDFIHIFQDMYGKDVTKDPKDYKDPGKRDGLVKKNGKYATPGMNGFAQNYCDGILHHKGEETTLTVDLVSEIMDMYVPAQLPVMSGLARHYAVSDLWFCSVPSQTNTNRAFWVSGASAGLVTNNFYCPTSWKDTHADKLPEGASGGIPYRRCLFDVLTEEKVTWKYYKSSAWPPPSGHYFKIMFDQFNEGKYEQNLPDVEQFYADAKDGKLPAVSYIEPSWGGGAHWDAGMMRMVGNEFHPVADMTCGELFVKQVFEAVSRGPKWDRTVLVITFDENGGTYDHLPPWEAAKTGRDPAAGAKPDVDVRCKRSAGLQFGFEFDCFGIRVPTLLISKFVRPATIFRSPTEVPFDHTSIIATILKWLQVDPAKWKLGNRVAAAPTFDGALEGDGEGENARLKNACGLRDLYSARASGGSALKYGDVVRLRYVGNKWSGQPPAADEYLGGPADKDKKTGWWYPVPATKGEALPFELVHPSAAKGAVLTGKPLVFRVHSGKAKNYAPSVPETAGYSKVYLKENETGENAQWRVWPVDDRNDGVALHDGDEVVIFSERYMWSRVWKAKYDPYMRLTIDPPGRGPASKRRVRWRAGEWDIWVIEKV